MEAKHYWYADARSEPGGVEVLEALRTYRAAEVAMRRRTQSSMGMGENDLLALRYLLKAAGEGRSVGPKDLSRYLGISTASTTVLLDRLQRGGHVTRTPSPHDRRALVIVPTVATDSEVRATLGEMHRRIIAVAKQLSPDEARTVIQFLEEMRDAVDRIDSHAEQPEPESAGDQLLHPPLLG